MGQCQHGQIAAHKGQVDAAQEGDGAVVLARRPEAVVGGGNKYQKDINHMIDMADGQEPGVLERQAEVEDIGVRIKRVGGRVDRFEAKRRRILTHFQVDTAVEENRQVEQGVGFDDIELVAIVRIDPVEFTQEVGVTGVG